VGGDFDGAPARHDTGARPEHIPLGVAGAVALDALALGGAVALATLAVTDHLDRSVAVGVVISVVTVALIGNVRVGPNARPGSTGRLLGRELAVMSLALLSLPAALGFSLHESLAGATIALAAVVAVAVGLRMALLTRRADQFGRVQAGRVAQLTRMALHDPLTGLPNRILLEDRLAMALAGQRRMGSVLAVLFCDLDHFKLVNDTFGHDGGDDVLITTATRLTSAVRATDTVSRLGGDEFVVLCPDLSSEAELTDVVERIVQLLSEPLDIGGRRASVSGSVGVAFVEGDAATPASLTDLLREADAAMYRAKANGRNRWERIAPEPKRPTPRYSGRYEPTSGPAFTD
jgi:diguanylate cyclase (GGDEF)-like protein